MKDISISTYSFPKLIRGGCLYVDKTMYIHKLASVPNGQFFMARPRRFGKSLTVSTLESLFKAERDLFNGLYIDSAPYDWKEYPVIHIDFARTPTNSLETMSRKLSMILSRIASSYGTSIAEDSPEMMFSDLIVTLHDKFKSDVVLLVDEYDKPLLDHLDDRDKDTVIKFRTFMDNFYQVIKGYEEFFRFIFITGVTRFSKVSIFSKLNNLDDITMRRDYSCMLGYTQDELERDFSEHIDKALIDGVSTFAGEKLDLDRSRLLSTLKEMYDGFRFSPSTPSVYNPVSVGTFFVSGGVLDNYWFSTATPSFLVKLLSRNDISLFDISSAYISSASRDTFDVAELSGPTTDNGTIYQLMYQSGYLTLEDGTSKGATTIPLRFPNKEVENSFLSSLFTSYTSRNPDKVSDELREAAMEGDTPLMIEIMQTVFASIPYGIQIGQEKYFQSIAYILFRLCGMRMSAEEQTNLGRIDGVLEAGAHTYIIEFKIWQSAEKAMEQIESRKYAQKYALPSRKAGVTLHRLAIAFVYGDGVRNIGSWKEFIID